MNFKHYTPFDHCHLFISTNGRSAFLYLNQSEASILKMCVTPYMIGTALCTLSTLSKLSKLSTLSKLSKLSKLSELSELSTLSALSALSKLS